MMTEVEDFDMDDQGEEEEDEEPLFADELGEDDDLPPLPPPMPSLSQLNSRQNGSTVRSCSYQGAQCRIDTVYTPVSNQN